MLGLFFSYKGLAGASIRKLQQNKTIIFFFISIWRKKTVEAPERRLSQQFISPTNILASIKSLYLFRRYEEKNCLVPIVKRVIPYDWYFKLFFEHSLLVRWTVIISLRGFDGKCFSIDFWNDSLSTSSMFFLLETHFMINIGSYVRWSLVIWSISRKATFCSCSLYITVLLHTESVIY